MIGLIVDGCKVSRWQAEALGRLGPGFEYVVLNSTRTRTKKRPWAHALYYALNIVSLKSPATRRVPLPASLRIVQTITFDAEMDGAWQGIPEASLTGLEKARPALIVKFGMGLLRIPRRLGCPILSYHHGDPRRFRGRPAGFYELLSGEPVIGQVVQILSDRLDSGQVVAFAETAASRHSYRTTMANAYRCSPLLLPRAVANCLAERILPLEPSGTNYRLPANRTVVKFCAMLAKAKLRRLAYGLFLERQWEVAQAASDDCPIEQLIGAFPARSQWRIVARPGRYRFLADPFPHPGGGLLVEALRRSDEQGEILHMRDGGDQVLCSGIGHFSYPGTVLEEGQCFVVPETAEWTAPTAFRLRENGAAPTGILAIEGHPRIIDPTLFRIADALYLFGNRMPEGAGVLRLWVADGLFEPFTEHPASPIRISPLGSRMGGAIWKEGERLIRIGQDGSRSYGDGLIVFEIERLTRADYLERRVGSLYFADAKGPHTLNQQQGMLLFDFYREKFTPFAGLRRIRAARSKRRAGNSPAC